MRPKAEWAIDSEVMRYSNYSDAVEGVFPGYALSLCTFFLQFHRDSSWLAARTFYIITIITY